MPFTEKTTNPDVKFDSDLVKYINKLELRIQHLEKALNKKGNA